MFGKKNLLSPEAAAALGLPLNADLTAVKAIKAKADTADAKTAETKAAEAAKVAANDDKVEAERKFNLQTSLISDVKTAIGALTGTSPVDLAAAVIALQKFQVQRTQELVEQKALFAALAELLGESAPATAVEAANLVRKHQSVLAGCYTTARGNPQVATEGDRIHASNALHVMGVIIGQLAEVTNRAAESSARELEATIKANDAVAAAQREVADITAMNDRLQRQVQSLTTEMESKNAIITSKNKEVEMVYQHAADHANAAIQAIKATIKAKTAAASADDPTKKLGEEILGMIPDLLEKTLSRGAPSNTGGGNRQQSNNGNRNGAQPPATP